MIEHKETEELPFLIERYQKEIWEWKQKESQWLEDRVMLDGTKKLVNQLSGELTTSKERVKRLDDSLTNALEINEEHQRYNGKLQTRVTDLEEDNKKLANQVDDQVERARKAGL